MKKTLAALLALISVVSLTLVACNKNNGGKGDDTSDDLVANIQPSGTSATTSSETTEETSAEPIVWTEKTGTVYVLFEANLRTEPNTKSTALGTAKFEDELELVAVSNNDSWYKVKWEGVECYIFATLATIDSGEATFVDLEATKKVYVTADETLNLRTRPCYYDGSLGTVVKRGGELTLEAVNENGNWARVKFDGKTYYCSNKYISETAPTDTDDQTSEVVVGG